MIRFRLRELIAERHFREGQLVTITEISRETGIHRLTLTKFANDPNYNAETSTLNLLCNYFKCRIEQLIEHVPDQVTKTPAKKLVVPKVVNQKSTSHGRGTAKAQNGHRAILAKK